MLRLQNTRKQYAKPSNPSNLNNQRKPIVSYSTFLSLSWSVSRGRDTYGYNIARLDDRNTDERFRCSGGGYDMVGTIFGKWLSANFQQELCELCEKRESEIIETGYSVSGYRKIESIYGLTIKPGKIKPGQIQLDGACGLDCMIRIAESIGLEVARKYNKRGQLNGFFVASKD